MTNYARTYRFGITPWERYATVAAASIAARLDHEEAERSRPLGRALDLGCGRGQYTPRASQEEVETAFAGWEMLTADPADTVGLGWPMNKTTPQWYRLRLKA